MKGDERDFMLFEQHLLPLHQELFTNLSNSTNLPFVTASSPSRALVNAEEKIEEEEDKNKITSFDAFKSLSVLVDDNAVGRYLLSIVTAAYIRLQLSTLCT